MRREEREKPGEKGKRGKGEKGKNRGKLVGLITRRSSQPNLSGPPNPAWERKNVGQPPPAVQAQAGKPVPPLKRRRVRTAHQVTRLQPIGRPMVAVSGVHSTPCHGLLPWRKIAAKEKVESLKSFSVFTFSPFSLFPFSPGLIGAWRLKPNQYGRP